MDEARAWLRKAEQDLRAGRILAASGEDVSGIAAFCCQQAAEKTLKGLLLLHGEPLERTHDLPHLLETLKPHEPEVLSLEDACDILDPYAVEVRYPSKEIHVTQAEAEEAVGHAEHVVGFGRSRIR